MPGRMVQHGLGDVDTGHVAVFGVLRQRETRADAHFEDPLRRPDREPADRQPPAGTEGPVEAAVVHPRQDFVDPVHPSRFDGGTLGGGVGSFLVQTNKVNLGMWGGLAYARERYEGEDPDNTLPAFIAVEYQYFVWGALNRELSSDLTILPILTGETRWRLQFTISMKWEIAHHLYLNLSLNEDFDSNPPSETDNRNSL